MRVEGYACIEGVVVPLHDARISVLDRGLLYGDGVFEVLRTANRRPFLLDRHLARLAAGAAAIRLTPPPGDLIAQQVARVVEPLAGDARIRILVTRGAGPLHRALDAIASPTLVVIAEPLRLPPDELYEHGIRLVTVARRMPPADTLDPRLKSLAYLDRVLALDEARRAGGDEAVRLDHAGHVAECATANLFAVMRGALVTPPTDVALAGVTRELVFDLATSAGVAAHQMPLTPAALAAAEELFVTSAVKGVVPVGALDGAPRPVGAITRTVIGRYRTRLAAT